MPEKITTLACKIIKKTNALGWSAFFLYLSGARIFLPPCKEPLSLIGRNRHSIPFLLACYCVVFSCSHQTVHRQHSSLVRTLRHFLLLRLKQVNIKDIQNLDQPDTITFPISGKKADRYYQNSYRFMPLVGSPGVAFIVVDEPPGTSANAVFNSVLSGWPVLVLTLLMALLSGIIMWGLVSNERMFPG